MVQVPKVEPSNGAEGAVETIAVTQQQLLGATHQVVTVPSEPQLLQVLSLKEGTATVLKHVDTQSVKEEANVTASVGGAQSDQ